MIKESILFLTHTDCGVQALKKHGLGIGPNTDLETVFVEPLRQIFSKVICYDLWKNYAILGVIEANRQIIEIVKRDRPKYVLWHTMMYELLENTLSEIRANGTLVLAWFSDDEVRFDDYSKWWVPYLDCILTGDKEAVKKYAALGAVAIHSVSGSNPAVFRKLNLPAKYEASFVGRKFGDRGQWIEQLNKSGINVEAFGSGWEAGYVATDEMVKIFNTSKINLCFMQSYGTNTRPQLKTRIFEICMCGGFLLCEYVSGIEDYFELDKEIVCFHDFEEAKGKIQYYFKNDEKRNAIAHAGWQKAKSNYTQNAMLNGIFSKVEQFKTIQRKTEMVISMPSLMPANVRCHPVQFHLNWARALMIEGFPKKRWEEEIKISLQYDPTSNVALRLLKISKFPAFLASNVVKLFSAIGRTKAIIKTHITKYPLAQRSKQAIKRLASASKQRKMERTLKNELQTVTPDGILDIRNSALLYTESLRIKDGAYGIYRYNANGSAPLLYASIYAAMLRHLLGDTTSLTQEECKEWIAYINNFQCEDGLYRDPLLFNDIAETEDWWGWRHLSAHVISALTSLGGKPRYSFNFLNHLYNKGAASEWISRLLWLEKPDYVSNTVMNYGVLLQYERDFNANIMAGFALDEIFAFLDYNINHDTGLWNDKSLRNLGDLSNAVQTAYHLWNLYLYDQRPIRHIEKAVDQCLATQNTLGGYGATLNSSACEDIDSVDPLCRFYFMTNYRRHEIKKSLEKALPWIFINQMKDGGFVFRRFDGFAYGNELMTTKFEESHMFATWFRMLSVAYICQVIKPSIDNYSWHWIKCPGYQFWHLC